MKHEKASSTGSAVSVWDSEARSYDSSRKADPVYLSCIHQTAKGIPRSARTVLDAGCGTGLSTIALKWPGRIVVAVDYSLESLKVLREKNLPNVFIIQADLAALPFEDGVFDGCTCANALRLFARITARLGYGHMLNAVVRKIGP
jgi:ubiquinone/menaquinone biosynthesis C-methylase UbiE